MKNFVASELIGQSVAYTIMGMCVVFFILIIIMYVIKAMALFSAPEKAQEKSEELPAEPEEEAVADESDETELVAVITAAIAAATGTNASGIIIKSYKRTDGGAWNRAGRREVLENRF